MLQILLTTFILPSLVTYILIKLLRIKLLWDEHDISKCPDDDVIIMTLIYPLGVAYIFVHCLAKLHFIIRSSIEYLAGAIINELKHISRSRYFYESFYGYPYPTRNMQHSYAMTQRDFGKPVFSLRKNTLREKTCTIAAIDYSTPSSQRRIFKRNRTIYR
ncbi:MAG: hypothetical protein PHO08_18830 [Methylococcales bacterium]|nr:hypothetical protein [Methylococcales bacterium]